MCRVRNAHRKSQPVLTAHPTRYSLSQKDEVRERHRAMGYGLWAMGIGLSSPRLRTAICVGCAMRTEKVNRCLRHTHKI